MIKTTPFPIFVFFFAFAVLLFVGCSNNDVDVVNTPEEVSLSFDYEDFGTLPWVVDIEKLTLANDNFRTTWWTGEYLQLTVMTIEPGGEIGLEAHPENDQFLRIEQGTANVYMGETEDNLTYQKEVSDDWAVFIPAGHWHNLVNTGDSDLKLYSIYSPAEHPAGTVHESPEDDDHHHHD